MGHTPDTAGTDMTVTSEHWTTEVDAADDTYLNFKVTFNTPVPGHPDRDGIEYQLEREHVEGLMRATYLGDNPDHHHFDFKAIIDFAEKFEPVCRFTAMLPQCGGGNYQDIVRTFLLPQEVTQEIIKLATTMPISDAVETALDNAGH